MNDDFIGQNVSFIEISKRNVNYQAPIRKLSFTDNSESAIHSDDIDLTIIAGLRPIRVVYRPQHIKMVTDFFAVDNKQVKQ